jgi:hypothetical protein
LSKRMKPVICDTQMNLEDIMLNEITQAQKDKYSVISLLGRI